MDLSTFGARATAGTLRDAQGVVLPHAWTGAGVVVGAPANGAQVLHLSVALCVLNDIYREAARLGVEVAGVVVEADGGFDDDWRSTGIVYAIELESPASGRNKRTSCALWTTSPRFRERSAQVLRSPGTRDVAMVLRC